MTLESLRCSGACIMQKIINKRRRREDDYVQLICCSFVNGLVAPRRQPFNMSSWWWWVIVIVFMLQSSWHSHYRFNRLIDFSIMSCGCQIVRPHPLLRSFTGPSKVWCKSSALHCNHPLPFSRFPSTHVKSQHVIILQDSMKVQWF